MKTTNKKFYFTIAILAMNIYDGRTQNLWGVDAGIDVINAEFQRDFIKTGKKGNYSNDTWTALSINDSNANTFPGSAYWERNTTGEGRGGYWNNAKISSNSQENGLAIFDSDFLDCHGKMGSFGYGYSPAGHKGELISPVINLNGNTDVPIAVKFYSMYRKFQMDELSISFSSDNGETWTKGVDYTGAQPESDQSFITVSLPLETTTKGVKDLSNCRIKFTFDGNYYFAAIDDVTIKVDDSLLIDQQTTVEKEVIYPNPAYNYLHFSPLKKDEKYSINDASGFIITEGLVTEDGKLNIQDLKSGVYFLKTADLDPVKFIKGK